MSGRRIRQSVRKAPDSQAIGRAVRAPGIDPRTWFAQGTVGSTTEDGVFHPDEAGTFDAATGQTRYDCVHVDRRGVLVDVQVLLHSGEVWPVTARYYGICGGPGLTIYSPIRPGDEVLVGFAAGRLENAYVVARLNNDAHPLQGDSAATTTPTWQNDRLLVDATEPLHLRAPAISIESPLVQFRSAPGAPARVVRNSSEPI